VFQPIHPSYAERATQTDATSGGEDEEIPQARGGVTARELVPQETYKPARQQKELGDLQAIEFSVRGDIGIRLSDALEGNWKGFEGRDDRSLFGGDRLQIMVRLRVRLLITIHISPQ